MTPTSSATSWYSKSSRPTTRSLPDAPEMAADSGGSSLLTVEVVSASRLRAPGLARWLQATAPRRARGTVVVALVSDARVRQLNASYRAKNAPTDVLSFGVNEPGFLGEVVIASGVARRQARRAGHSVQVELRILGLHGLLHLLAMITSEMTAGWPGSNVVCAGRVACAKV